MVALMAQRAGCSGRAYLYSRTPTEIMLDIEAWIASWAFPASVIAGGKKGSGEQGNDRRPGRSRDPMDKRPWLRKLRNPPGHKGGRVIVTDLDEIAKMPPEQAEAALRASGLSKVVKKKTAAGKVVPVSAEVSDALSKKIAEGWASRRFRGTT